MSKDKLVSNLMDEIKFIICYLFSNYVGFDILLITYLVTFNVSDMGHKEEGPY